MYWPRGHPYRTFGLPRGGGVEEKSRNEKDKVVNRSIWDTKLVFQCERKNEGKVKRLFRSHWSYKKKSISQQEKKSSNNPSFCVFLSVFSTLFL